MRKALRAASVLAVIALMAAGCGSDDKGSNASDSGTTKTTASSSSADIDWGVGFTGGKKGAASGDPVYVGYANNETGTTSFPDATHGVKAALKLVNEDLGGFGGRPIELVECGITSDEEAQACATQFLNDDRIDLIVTGVLAFGGATFNQTIGGKKVVDILTPLGPQDLFPGKKGEDTNYYSLTTSGTTYSFPAMAKYAAVGFTPKPKTVAVLSFDNPGTHALIDTSIKPMLDAEGVALRQILVPATASAPDVVSALQAGRIDDVDLVIRSMPGQSCAFADQALRQLKYTKPVLDSGGCSGPAVTKYLESIGQKNPFPDGTIVPDYGVSSYIKSEADAGGMTFARALITAQNNGTPATQDILSINSFGGIMALAKLLNDTGVDTIDQQTFGTAFRSYTGPLLGVDGDIQCGGNANIPVICDTGIGFVEARPSGMVRIAGKGADQPLVHPFE